MGEQIIVQNVTQDVLIFVWFKHGALEDAQVQDTISLQVYNLLPEISKELIINLRTSVWIESFRTLYIWEDFFEKHFDRMISSSKLFAGYVGYICYILNECTDAHESFFDILSFVTDVSIRCLERDQKPHLNTCVDLFCSFFEKELRTKFENQGGWRKLNEYLVKQYNLIESKSLIGDDELPDKLFDYFREAHERSSRPDRADSCNVVYKKRIKPHYVVNGIVTKEITQIQVENNEKAIKFSESVEKKIEILLQKTFHEMAIEFSKTTKQLKERYQWTVVGASGVKSRKVEKPFTQKEATKEFSRKTDNGTKVPENKMLPTTNILKPHSLDTSKTQSVSTLQPLHLVCDEKERKVEKPFMKKGPKEISRKTDAGTKVLESKTLTTTNTLKPHNLVTIQSQEVVSAIQALPLQPKSTKRGIAETLLGNMSDAFGKLFEIIQPLFEEYGGKVPDVLASEVGQSSS